MLDINLIREKPEWVKQQVANRNDTAPIDEILALDLKRREILAEVEDLRAQRNVASKEIGRIMGKLKQAEKSGNSAEAAEISSQVETVKEKPRKIGERIATLDEELRSVDTALQDAMLWVPNMPDASTPIGPDEASNVIRPSEGAPKPQFNFEPKAHWDLGIDLDIIDFERGVKLSGSRFYLLKGQGAHLQRAVIQFMLDFHIEKHGYTEIYPPFIVQSKCFEGAAQLPKFFDNIYRDAEQDLMLLATAEVALTNVHRDEILEEAEMPKKYVAYSPCFRREKMSAGKDVRGIKRGHQFDKVEMYRYALPELSWEFHEEMLQDAKDICDALGFHYRVLELATGDIGFGMAKTYDIEVWAAGCGDWLEISSISNALDFQARRANIRYRPADGGKLRFPHTLNASGLALPRVMIAIMENNQREDGTIEIPEVLRPYMRGQEQIG